MNNTNWYTATNAAQLISPSLLVYPDRIRENIKTMIKIAGGTQRLRPHVKTHKMAEIIQMQLDQGISKFKCATIAEAELLGKCGAKDVLLAMQPVGPDIERFFTLVKTFPSVTFSTLADTPQTVQDISKMAASKNTVVGLWVDINNGMDRSGILPDSGAKELYMMVNANPHLQIRGLHVYDGHIREPDFSLRKQHSDEAFQQVTKLIGEIEGEEGVGAVNILAGGSPSFPVHAQRKNVELGPGTALLWDARYGGDFPDMPFLPAAVLLSRIISKPNKNILCLDLGHKSLAPEMPLPRVQFLNLKNTSQIGQSEEHLVVSCEQANDYRIGDIIYAIPMHICPTVAKYGHVTTIIDGEATGTWSVAARNQKITI
ncbi:MAG: D-TA family PLP-dependent enzyme [Flavobacteriaceae bacterium]